MSLGGAACTGAVYVGVIRTAPCRSLLLRSLLLGSWIQWPQSVSFFEKTLRLESILNIQIYSPGVAPPRDHMLQHGFAIPSSYLIRVAVKRMEDVRQQRVYLLALHPPTCLRSAS